MPKANNKDVYYFSHDCNARNDEKILALRSVYQNSGYGMYWILVEILREQKDYKIKLNKFTWGTLAMQMQCTADEIKDFVNACVEDFALFKIENDCLFSESLCRRMALYDEISAKRKAAAESRWNKDKDIPVENDNPKHDSNF